jgi:hypothetical protein
MIKPIVQTEILKGWGVNPEEYFGTYQIPVAIEIDPRKDPEWIDRDDIFKVVVQVEPPSVMDKSGEYLLENWNKFDLILTYYEEILELPNSQLCFFGGTWIKEPKKTYAKSKKISFITSNKNFCPGHQTRMEIVNLLRDKFDLFGRGFNPIENKDEGLNDYMFSLAIENEIKKNWFTEKIVDCFTTKTIPIYNGCPNIDEFYDVRGIITFTTIDELIDILDTIDENKYVQLLEFAEINYKKSIETEPFNKRVETAIKERISNESSN